MGRSTLNLFNSRLQLINNKDGHQLSCITISGTFSLNKIPLKSNDLHAPCLDYNFLKFYTCVYMFVCGCTYIEKYL